MAKTVQKESQKEIDTSSNTESRGFTVSDTVSNIQEKPLVFTLDASASKEQIRLAKIFNGFAYQYPEQFKIRKNELIKLLEDAKYAPDPVINPDRRLSVGTKPPVELQ